MNPKLYEDRAKHKSLPLDFQYQDAAGYTSNWEYLKEKYSTYHFDKWVLETEGTWWHNLGNFPLPESITTRLPSLIVKSKDVGWFDVTSKHHPGFPGAKSPLLEQEEYDRLDAGMAGREFVQVVPEPEVCTTHIQKLADYWCLGRCRTRVHVQFPGQMFPTHVDKLWHRYPQDPSKLIRIVIMLNDYEPGQLMVYGNSVLTQWRAGDVHCFDTLNVPHSTANMSRTPRVSLIVTGFRTPETDTKLLASSSTSIHEC